MSLPVSKIVQDLFGDPTIETSICREGSYVAYTEDYDLWIADRFRVSALGKEFYIWSKDNDWGVIEENLP